MLLPDDPIKLIWEWVVMVFLLYTFIVTPYSIAFIDEPVWYIITLDVIVDCVFSVDIIVNFFIAYYDRNYKLVDCRKKIAIKYLCTWFLIDFFSILPFNLISNN